jgi:hypothetical protein
MEKDKNMYQEQEYQDSNRKANFNDKRVPHPDGKLPEDDPMLINPDELATFPEEQKNPDRNVEDENESHLVNRKSSPVREGRNITRTDTTADNDGGFM